MSRFGSPFGPKRPWYARWVQVVPKLPTVPIAKRGPKSRLNRRQSPLRVRATPILIVLIACLMPLLVPMVSNMPLLPPFGFMTFIAWRLLRPGIWPLWVGFPFGLFDDICSGQPFGSGALLWSIAILALEIWEQRLLARDYIMDWILAGLALILLLVGGVFMVGLTQIRPPLSSIVPQLIIALMLFPLIMRGIAAADRWRLAK
jgi:rod shape-determining protein MreD